METINNVNSSSLSVIDVTGMVLSAALNRLKETGFANVREEPNGDIWDKDNWIVAAQSIAAGTKVNSNQKIQLDCIKLDAYLNKTCPGMTLVEVQAAAAASGFGLRYESTEKSDDLSSKVLSMDEKTKAYWVVDKARQFSGAAKTAVVSISYLGSPEEKAAELAKKEAEEAAKKAQQELVKKLEAFLPKETAKKAIVVAFTNNSSLDVFTADGNNFDPSKFHDYNYNGEFKQTVTKEGTWTVKNEKSWHVENMYLLIIKYDHATKLSCDVTFDGSNYIISGVRYMNANSKYIDSEDPSKISGWMDIEPSKFNKFLTVSASLIR